MADKRTVSWYKRADNLNFSDFCPGLDVIAVILSKDHSISFQYILCMMIDVCMVQASPSNSQTIQRDGKRFSGL